MLRLRGRLFPQSYRPQFSNVIPTKKRASSRWRRTTLTARKSSNSRSTIQIYDAPTAPTAGTAVLIGEVQKPIVSGGGIGILLESETDLCEVSSSRDLCSMKAYP